MFKLIEGPYLNDILAQPKALSDTLHSLASAPPNLAKLVSSGAFARIVLTGMGSSFHALYPLHLFFLRHGFNSLHVETSELCLNMRELFTRDALVIAVSQSGRSAETLELLDLAAGTTRILAVTNDAQSPLALRADEVMLLRAGVEATVSCKTYLATLMTLEWLAASIGGADMEAKAAELSGAAEAVDRYLRAWREHVVGITEIVNGARQTYVIGRGRSLAAAGTGGLILKEATRTSAEGMSSAAFRHGPFEVVGPRVFVAALAGDGTAMGLNQRLVDDIRAAGGIAQVIGASSTAEPFRIPLVPESIRPVLEMLPIQMLSLALAGLRGEEAGTFRLASKITVIS